MYSEVAVFYSNNSKEVYIRTGSWKKVNHSPWFLVAKPQIPRIVLDKVVRVTETDVDFYEFNRETWRYEKVGKAYRVETKLPQDVRSITKVLEKNGIKHSLSNIRYLARVSLDLLNNVFGIKTPAPVYYEVSDLEQLFLDVYEKSKNIRIAVLDIEVGNEGRFPQTGDPVIAVGIGYGTIGGDLDVEILEGGEVSEAVDRILKYEPDYLIGFNIHGFDLPYLSAYVNDSRIITNGQQQYIVDGNVIVPVLDLLQLAVNYGQSLGLKSTVSRSLLQVSKDLGVITKEEEEIEKSIDHNNMLREYKENREKVIKYLETDVKLTFSIIQEWFAILAILHVLTGISPFSQQFLPSMGGLAEYSYSEYLLRKHRMALEVRSREYNYGEIESTLIPYISKGHKVVAIEGVYKGKILQLDFDMLYPSIYFSDYVDPLSVRTGKGFLVFLYNDVEQKKLGVAFSGGPLHKFFTYMYMARKASKRIKKERNISSIDQAIKILANSAYGVLSKRRGNGVNEIVSAYIFYRANQVLNTAQRIVELKFRREVLYGDTDSLFIQLENGDDPSKLAEEINTTIKRLLGDSFDLKFEGVHETLVVYSKKNYIVITSSGDVVVKGMHRFPMPVVVKENFDMLVKKVLSGTDPETAVKELLKSARRVDDLFVNTVKHVEELTTYSKNYKKKGRNTKKLFKESIHPSTRALLLSYLVFDVGMVPERPENIFAKQYSTKIIIDETVVESGRILSPQWLKKQKNTVCVLYSVKDSSAELICGRFSGKPKVDEHHLEQNVTLWRETASKDQLIEYALVTLEPLLAILNKIYSMSKGGTK